MRVWREKVGMGRRRRSREKFWERQRAQGKEMAIEGMMSWIYWTIFRFNNSENDPAFCIQLALTGDSSTMIPHVLFYST